VYEVYTLCPMGDDPPGPLRDALLALAAQPLGSAAEVERLAALTGRWLHAVRDQPAEARRLSGEIAMEGLLGGRAPEGPDAAWAVVEGILRGFAQAAEDEPVPVGTRKERILRLLEDGPLQPTEIADALGMRTSHVSNALGQLRAEGQVARSGVPGDARRARYALTVTTPVRRPVDGRKAADRRERVRG
jgi:CRP-like cAMP-binding protein